LRTLDARNLRSLLRHTLTITSELLRRRPSFLRLQTLPAKFGPQEFRSDFAPLAQLHQLASDLRNVNLLLTDSDGDLGRKPAALVEHIRQVRTGAWIRCRAEHTPATLAALWRVHGRARVLPSMERTHSLLCRPRAAAAGAHAFRGVPARRGCSLRLSTIPVPQLSRPLPLLCTRTEDKKQRVIRLTSFRLLLLSVQASPDVVLLCYSHDDPMSLVRLADVWIPAIRAAGPQKASWPHTPICLCGTKVDRFPESEWAGRLGRAGCACGQTGGRMDTHEVAGPGGVSTMWHGLLGAAAWASLDTRMGCRCADSAQALTSPQLWPLLWPLLWQPHYQSAGQQPAG
jgi:hypothetical protein